MGVLLKQATWRVPTDEYFAQYLGLSMNEYSELNHTGIHALCDHKGTIIQYYTTISPLNPEHLLRKIRMNKMRMVYFPA